MSGPAAATAEQARALDSAAADLGVAQSALMALAGFACARVAQLLLEELAPAPKGHICILAGRGNNGADALGCARHLALWGEDVRCVTLADPLGQGEVYSGQARAAEASSVALRTAGEEPSGDVAWGLDGARLVIDGLLGTGSQGPPRGRVAVAIAALGRAATQILAIDLPSGLDADTGERPGDCVRAHDTLMLAVAKQGCQAPSARPWTGRLWLADIGVPGAAYRRVGLDLPGLGRGGLVRLEEGSSS